MSKLKIFDFSCLSKKVSNPSISRAVQRPALPNLNPDQTNLLLLQRLPARLTVDETSWLLGFSPRDVSVLVAVKLLKPLGHPALNGQKYFAACELERLRNDADWLAKASDSLVRHWRKRNGKKLEPTLG
jgi:hypothetical protein